MPDPTLTHTDLAIQIGRLEGRFTGLETTVTGIAADVKQLVSKESARSGAEAKERNLERQREVRGHRNAGFVGAGIGGLLTLAGNAIGRKLGWLP
jgi:hypothetical protein